MTSRLLLRNGAVQSLTSNSHSISKRWMQNCATLRAGAKTRMFESLGAPEVEPKYQARRIKKQTPKLGQAKAAIDDIVKNKWARPDSATKPMGKKKPQDNKADRPHQQALDKHPEKHMGEPTKLHQRHVEKFTQEHKHKGDAKRSKKKEEEKARIREEERLAAIKYEKELKAEAEAKEKKNRLEQEQAEKVQRDVYIPEVVNVANLARVLGIRLEQLISTMKNLEMENTKHDHIDHIVLLVLNADESSLIAMELDMNPIVDSQAALDLYPRAQPEDMSIFPSKPPIVTIMGHVDHGKTTLLDTLRKSSVAAGEAGGITQHIGAFSVDLPSRKRITFLDTPGHAAFSAMRSRGANVTDIVVLVVAADDGVMPQTIEAIKHAQSANVPIIVAINKCDKHGADPNRVKQELLQHEIQLEEFGGDVASVEVSGLTGKGLDELEENIITLAEVLDLRAERNNTAEGIVLESNIEKGRGNVATILVRSGTLKTGGHIVAGNTMCKVRSMTDDKGKIVKEALPGQPVKVIGWKELPSAGDEMLQATTESVAKTVVANRIAKEQRKQQLQDLEVINEKRRRQREQVEAERNAERQYKKDMWMFHQGLITQYPETLNKRLSAINGLTNAQDEEEDKVKEYRAIVKGDVSGTVEAVVDCLNGLQTPEVRVKVVSSGVGNISESDVQLAAASEGHIIGFNVKADKRIQQEASMNNVSIKSYNIIYKLLDDVKSNLCEMLPPIVTTQVNGEATIQQVFQITVKGRETKPVAGCRITNGTVSRNGRVRVVRNRETVWEGDLETLKQVKKDISEAKKGLECGMSFEGFIDFKEGDVIQSIQTVETPRTL
ncbi:hypothetical protein NQZ79_g6981 [Umbelopsis isabellina]|nr:hypothetical protein NQZ79_g6981 [Umbelopsis isabellina]